MGAIILRKDGKGGRKRKSLSFPLVVLLVLTITSLFIRKAVLLCHEATNISLSSSSLSLSSVSSSNSSCSPKRGLKPIKQREEFGKLCEEYGLKTGLEVGVQRGNFAQRTLTDWPSCDGYHLVDLWKHQDNYKDTANVDDDKQIENFKIAQKNTNQWKNITKFYSMYSSEAAKEFRNESIDFIYLDARHDYCGVMEDLVSYWPIVTKGGILSGHDYKDNIEVKSITKQDWGLCMDGTRNERAVKGAVQDFFLPMGLTISITYKDSWNSWMVHKPLC